jgi:entry exclusion lipoprotein TrbK
MRKRKIFLASLTVATLASCDNRQDPLLEVNDANCRIETITRIEDKLLREKFAGLCSRRSVIAPTSKPLNWLELDPALKPGEAKK